MNDLDAIISAFVTLFVTIDPPGLVPIFVALTAGMTNAHRRKVALYAVLIASGVLAFFALFGQSVLDALTITLPAFRVAGGLFLFWIAFEMVFERRSERKNDSANRIVEHDHSTDLAAFPLGVPLIAGPGAITAVILLSGGAQNSISGDIGADMAAKAVIIALIAFVMTITLAVLVAGVWIDRYLPASVQSIATRLLGVLLAALAVQYVADGVRALIAA